MGTSYEEERVRAENMGLESSIPREEDGPGKKRVAWTQPRQGIRREEGLGKEKKNSALMTILKILREL